MTGRKLLCFSFWVESSPLGSRGAVWISQQTQTQNARFDNLVFPWSDARARIGPQILPSVAIVEMTDVRSFLYAKVMDLMGFRGPEEGP